MKLHQLSLLGDAPIPWIQGTIIFGATAGGCALGSYLSWRLVAQGWSRAVAGLVAIAVAASLSALGFVTVAAMGIRQ
jgi:hypothetical protein